MSEPAFHLAEDPLVKERLDKARKLAARGVDPFGRRFDGAEAIAAVRARCPEDSAEGTVPPPARAAGRIMRLRDHGKVVFLDLADRTGTIQVYLRRDDIGAEAFEVVRLLDLGDHLGVEGAVKKTHKGEISIFAARVVFLGKALLPIPEKWHGLKDVELRYRHRYVDLFANPGVRDGFVRRAAILRDIRSYLEARGFLEVETPMMHAIAGGAAARPFVTHLHALDMPLFLRVAPELYLKRLLVGGLERVFELNRNFRNEGMSPRHNPEFTMLEVYQAYADYEEMMTLTEGLVADAAARHAGGLKIRYQGREIDFTPPFRRARYRELFAEAAGFALDDRARVEARAKELEVWEAAAPFEKVVNAVFETLVEPTLVQPTFVCDFPRALCPLAKARADDPEVAERFELIVSRMELANAFTELNDPVDQEARFRAQVASRDEEAPGEVDYDYVRALAHGMPPAGGLGVGIDRLVMLLTDAPSIKDVILFPFLRRQGAGEA
ncbi:MAG: lysine--tRNA ligase [Planctomycetes bacterium]|nr:lysine--tRNA ligase [Planctomycetota bacterium]